MSAPAEKTLKSLDGDWTMNKKLSGDTDSILALQGVGWLTRKAIALATITLHIKEYTDDNGVVHIDIEQTGTAGLRGTTELRTLDWVESEHEDHIFGKVKGRSRWIKLDDITDDFLKEGWLPEMKESQLIESLVDSVGNGWTAHQIWGFEEIGDARRYVRHVIVTKKDVKKIAKLVYDFQK